jgi:hypothetical protein
LIGKTGAILSAVALTATLSAPGLRAQEASPAARPLKVAVYTDTGTTTGGAQVLKVLATFPDLTVASFSAADIRAGKLAGYDVLLHPGGSGGGQGKALGEEGREKVREFVKGGGGYVGICAGAYLASCDYPWSLHILDAKVIDKAHWARGNGDVQLSLSSAGMKRLGAETDRQQLAYYQGPLLAPAGDPEVPDYEKLATFESEIALKGAPTGVMIGTTAIASGGFGAGHVLCFSPHPEKTPGKEPLLHQGLRWVARRP